MNKKYAELFNTPKNRVIVALDNVESLEQVATLVALLSPYVGWFKVGFETILGFGAKEMIEVIRKNGGKVFLDVKLHDIPNTMVNAVKNINKMGVEMFNVHCSAGIMAMVDTKKASPNSLVIGVTVLTSLNDDNCEVIYGKPVRPKVIDFALETHTAGLDGIVSSATDLKYLSEQYRFGGLLKITPGIQFPDMSNDQKRVTTPYQAIKDGATAIVVGRAITGAEDKVAAAQRVLAEVEKAMNEIAQNA